MHFFGLLLAIFLVVAYSWWADWTDRAHMAVLIVLSVVGPICLLPFARKSGPGGPGKLSITMKMPRKQMLKKWLFQQSVYVLGTSLLLLCFSKLLAYPASYLFIDRELKEARSRVRHLKLEGTWPALVEASDRYGSKWKATPVQQEFARHKYDAHLAIASDLNPGKETLEHWTQALRLVEKWNWDRRLAEIGIRLCKMDVIHRNLTAEHNANVSQLNSLQAELHRLRAVETELGSVRSENVSFKSSLGQTREKIERVLSELEILQQEKITTGQQLAMREREVLQLKTLVTELRMQLEQSRTAAQAKPKPLPEGTVVEIHRVDFGDILPTVLLTLRAPDGTAVGGLHARDFRVRLNSEEKEIIASVNYADRGEPADVMLAFDLSQSVGGPPLKLGKKAANEFLQQLAGRARFSMITFNSTPKTNVEWTTDSSRLMAAVDRFEPGGETAIYDAIWLALDEFEQTIKQNRYLIIFTDGRDTSSKRDYQSTIGRAQQIGIPVFSIGLNGKSLDAKFLQAVSTATGGRYVHADSPKDLIGIYRRLAGEIQSRYRLVVALDETDGLLEVIAGGKNAASMSLQLDAVTKKSVIHK